MTTPDEGGAFATDLSRRLLVPVKTSMVYQVHLVVTRSRLDCMPLFCVETYPMATCPNVTGPTPDQYPIFTVPRFMKGLN